MVFTGLALGVYAIDLRPHYWARRLRIRVGFSRIVAAADSGLAIVRLSMPQTAVLRTQHRAGTLPHAHGTVLELVELSRGARQHLMCARILSFLIEIARLPHTVHRV